MITKKITLAGLCIILTFCNAKPNSMFERITEVGSAQELKELIANPNPLVVMFYAVWCGVCNQIKAPFEKSANKSIFSHVRFVCIDSDKFRDIADNYTIKGVPTFLFFKNRVLIHSDVGVEHLDQFQTNFEKTMQKAFSSDSVSLSNLIDYETTVKAESTEQDQKPQGFIMGMITRFIQLITNILWYIADKITDLFIMLSNLLRKIF